MPKTSSEEIPGFSFKPSQENTPSDFLQESGQNRAIAREIQIKLTPQEQTRLAIARPVNPEAHDQYLLGLHFYQRGSAEGAAMALVPLERAVAFRRQQGGIAGRTMYALRSGIGRALKPWRLTSK